MNLKSVSLLMLLVLVTFSGCEMTIGIPKSKDAPKDVKPVKIEAVEGRTPLELLETNQKNVKTVYYPDWGYYVTEIGKVKNEIEKGPDGRYWVLYIDGKQIKEGTDTIRLKGNEEVEFRFQRPSQ